MNIFGAELFKDAKKPLITKKKKAKKAQPSKVKKVKSKTKKAAPKKVATKKTTPKKQAPKKQAPKKKTQKRAAVNCPECGKFYNPKQGKTCLPCRIGGK